MKRKWCVWLVVAMIVSLGLAGCSSDDTTVSSSGDTIKASATAVFTGQVLNVLDKPMKNVTVTLYAANKYQTKTDSYGNYLINVALGDVIAAPGGGSNQGEANIGDDADVIKRVFPIVIDAPGHAEFREEIYFEGVLGYTDGSGAVMLLSQVGQYIPTIWLDPFVDNFKFTVYAGTGVAPYATVSLYPDYFCNDTWWDDDAGCDDEDCIAGIYWEHAGWYETGMIQLHADANGVVEITAEDEIPCQWYGVFAAPYDADGDGIFEYDASATTQPGGVFGGFDLSVGLEASDDSLLNYIYDSQTDTFELVQTELAPSVLLTDNIGINDIEVVYFNLQNMENIPQAQSADMSFVVMLSRPIIIPGGFDFNTLFKLTNDDGSVVPLTLVSNTGNYLFVLKPMNTLTPVGNEYTFYVMLDRVMAYDGAMANDCWFSECFNIYDPNATSLAAITPGIDLAGFNEFDSYVVDWDDIWKVWYEDDDSFGGAEPAGWIQFFTPCLRLSWAASQDCNGYDVYVRDTDTAWQLIDEDDLMYTYNDGQFIEATVYLDEEWWNALYCDPMPTEFANYDEPWDRFAPFFAGNVMKIVVMPRNINGFAQDPNTDPLIVGLILADNLGPVLTNPQGGGPLPWFFPYTFAEPPNYFTSCTYYDDTRISILVQEPLKDVELVAENPEAYGAWASSGSFKVANVYWPDPDLTLVDGEGVPYPSNRAYIMIDLEPTIAVTSTEDAIGYGGCEDCVGFHPENGDNWIYVAGDNFDTFAVGDHITLGDYPDNYESIEELSGFVVEDSIFLLDENDPIQEDWPAGTPVYFAGPIQSGYDGINLCLEADTDAYADVILVEHVSLFEDCDGVRITAPEDVLVDDGWPLSDYFAVYNTSGLDLADDLTDAYPHGTTVEGYVIGCEGFGDTTVTTAVTGTTIEVGDASNFAEGDLVVFDFYGTPILRTVTAAVPDPVEGPDTITVSTSVTVEAGMDVDEYETFSTIIIGGYPFVSVTNISGVQPNSTCTFDDLVGEEQATAHAVVTAALSWYGSDYLVLDSILKDGEGARYNFPVNETNVYNDSSRQPDALQVKLKDRSGNDSSAWYDQIGYEEVGAGSITVF